MQTGDLIIVRGGSLIDRAIEGVEHSQFSHVAGIVNDVQIIQAEGFQLTGYGALSVYAGQDVFNCPDLTDAQRRQIVAFARAQVGTHYAYGLLFYEWVRYVFHLLLPWWVERRKFICSTLWSDAYRAAGVDLCPGVRYPSPADLAASKQLVKIGIV